MIFDLLAGLHRSHRLTSVLVTHNQAFARRCDRIVTLDKGGLVPDGVSRRRIRKPGQVIFKIRGLRKSYV